MQLHLREFQTASATHIVSLGPRCAVAYNLRRHFDFSGAFPFDWWIAELAGLESFLDSLDVERLYDPAHLELTRGRGSVRHVEFGFLFHHEFPRDWNLPGHPVQAGWQEHLARAKQRTTALVGKLRSLNARGRRIAFIREGEASAQLAARLDALFPLADWTLVGLTSMMTDEAEYGWRGDPNLWTPALTALGIVLDTTGHRRFAERSTNPETDSKSVGSDIRTYHTTSLDQAGWRAATRDPSANVT